jgi:hypothetical protein
MPRRCFSARIAALIISSALAVGCSAPETQAPSIQASTAPHACDDTSVVKPVDDHWGPNFGDEGVTRVRQIGGFYRALRATSHEQHRSLAGPTFRIRCGVGLDAQLLLGIPASAGETYQGTLVAFLDYTQISFGLDGVVSFGHSLSFEGGSEHILRLTTTSIPEGIHRLAILLVDDHPLGLDGVHDLLADLYVGNARQLATLQPPTTLLSKPDSAVSPTHSSYGIVLSASEDKLSMPGPRAWNSDVPIYASFWGPGGGPPHPAVIAALQGERQLPIAPASVIAVPGQVSRIRLQLRRPAHEREALWALLFTNPDVELVSSSGEVTEREARVLASGQAAVLP